MGQEQTILAQSFTVKPEQVFQKLAISGRKPLKAGTQRTAEYPSLSDFQLFILGPVSWASKGLLFWTVG